MNKYQWMFFEGRYSFVMNKVQFLCPLVLPNVPYFTWELTEINAPIIFSFNDIWLAREQIINVLDFLSPHDMTRLLENGNSSTENSVWCNWLFRISESPGSVVAVDLLFFFFFFIYLFFFLFYLIFFSISHPRNYVSQESWSHLQ